MLLIRINIAIFITLFVHFRKAVKWEIARVNFETKTGKQNRCEEGKFFGEKWKKFSGWGGLYDSYVNCNINIQLLENIHETLKIQVRTAKFEFHIILNPLVTPFSIHPLKDIKLETLDTRCKVDFNWKFPISASANRFPLLNQYLMLRLMSVMKKRQISVGGKITTKI